MFSILIVEDNKVFRNSLRDVLRVRFPSMGIEEASDGEEALSKILKCEPDIIFMDIKLPGRNGLELTKIIKKTGSKISVIILTSYDIPEYREAAMRCGASHFLTKGNANGDEIAAVISSILETNGN